MGNYWNEVFIGINDWEFVFFGSSKDFVGFEEVNIVVGCDEIGYYDFGDGFFKVIFELDVMVGDDI